MQLPDDSNLQLTYCTNIHPSNGWRDVLASLRHYGPALKARIAPDKPFGIGLRLSGQESVELLQGDQLAQFHDLLHAQGLYVFTLNGFPYGPFHNQPVKAVVHAPDWRDEERVQYTLRLVEILAALLPAGMDGGISTSPLSYRAWVNTTDASQWQLLACNISRVAAAMAAVFEREGKLLHLDIEPEPDGLLERSEQLVDFFERWLLTHGAEQLAATSGVSLQRAREQLLEHVRVCFDTCHVAVAYEAPAAVLDRLEAAGIKVGKIQVSSALRLNFEADTPRHELVRALRPFAESTYLHQVIQQNRDGSLYQYPDLPDALQAIDDPQIAQWRVHFHVPIFIERYGIFDSTQDTILQTFAELKRRHFTNQLEIETYTWGVLPPELKVDLAVSISREYEWVLDNL